MKASDLIRRLSTLITHHGDLEVRIWNEVEREFDSINEIEPRRFLDHQRAADEERQSIFFGVDPYNVGDEDAQLRYDQRSTEG